MFDRLQIFRVFLASPGDLAAERDAARQVVDGVHPLVHDFSGYHVELVVWEDAMPGCSRPQSLINPGVDHCDLFVGLLWKRWGQPTGSYGSGFEEEFERARTRRRSTSAPEIWLYFKDIPQDQQSDPGEQLQRVLAFRHRLRDDREGLAKTFADTTEWREQFTEHLLRFLLSQELEARVRRPSESSPAEGP